MPSLTVETCPLCSTPMEARGFPPGTAPVVSGKMGLVVEVGYSSGGWGHRRDTIKFGKEVCPRCYEHAGKLSEKLLRFLRKEDQRPEPSDIATPLLT